MAPEPDEGEPVPDVAPLVCAVEPDAADALPAADGVDVPAVPRAGVVESDGIDTDGVLTPGVETDGTVTDGVETEGVETDGTVTEGVEPAGVETDGIVTDGVETDGTVIDGVDRAGVETDGKLTAFNVSASLESGATARIP